MDLESYTDTDRDDARAAFVPGVGCTINGMIDMNNIESTHSSTYDTAGLHRSKDPGTTAFCPFHSAISNAIDMNIPAGSEIFAAYGGEWIPDIPGARVTYNEPMDSADDFMVRDYYPFIAQNQDRLSPELKDGLWSFMKSLPLYSKVYSNLPTYVPWSEVEEVLASQREKIKRGESVAPPGVSATEAKRSSSIVRSFIQKTSRRTLEWLNEHGRCQDHIQPLISTIPQAGRGAFATRDLPQGTVVGYSPLIHVGADGIPLYTLEYIDDVVDEKTKKTKKKRRKQLDLVVNYSFGHPNSTIMLTPYGGMINYINHAPTVANERNGNRTANVQVRWPLHEMIAHKPHWLNKSASYFHYAAEKIGLSFEYMALRDIKQGEEVFMDYGPAWEAAWEKYVADWRPVPGADEYVHSTEWKEPFLRTSKELVANPYPPNLITLCRESYSLNTTASRFEYVPPLNLEDGSRLYCTVLDRVELFAGSDSPEYRYTVEFTTDDDDTVVVHNYDKIGVAMYNKAYTSDFHLPNAFRHAIHIPDHIFPPAWKNIL
jgi:SET domain